MRLIIRVVLAFAISGDAAALAARGVVPPHVTAEIAETARQARALARRRGEFMMIDVVVGAIAETPALVGEIVATAVAAAPELRAGIARGVAQAFPGFAARISAAAAAPAPAPSAAATRGTGQTAAVSPPRAIAAPA